MSRILKSVDFTKAQKSKYLENKKKKKEKKRKESSTLCRRRQLPKLQLLNFLAKFLSESKYLMKTTLTIIKSINSQTSNNTSPGNDGLKAGFYKHFSNELAPALLDVYDSWGKFGTISVTCRIRIISATYKEGDKRDIENYRPNSFLKLYHKIYTTILKGYLH